MKVVKSKSTKEKLGWRESYYTLFFLPRIFHVLQVINKLLPYPKLYSDLFSISILFLFIHIYS